MAVVKLEVDDPAVLHRCREVTTRLGVTSRFELVGGADSPLRVDGIAAPWTGDAPPPDWFLEAVILRALSPRHVLFLCVANSARSQLGEGVGRLLAPEGVRVSSAGSEPTRVRPQAIAVMKEIGVDLTTHEAKGMDDVERPVDAVITLCAEESCPAWLEKAWRLHWPLPDPAGAGSTGEEEMAAFRGTRDELRRRLAVVFGD